MDLYGFSHLVANLSLTGVAGLFYRIIGTFKNAFDWKNNGVLGVRSKKWRPT